MALPDYSVFSTYRKMLLEHLFAGEVMRHAWRSGVKRLEVLKPHVDDGGYDMVLEGNGIVRHVQLKATFRGSTVACFNVNTALALKPSGCVIVLLFDPESLELGPFLWLGGQPGDPRPNIDHYDVAKHTKGNAQGAKLPQPNLRVVSRSAFEPVTSIAGIVEKLFGVLAIEDRTDVPSNKHMQPSARRGDLGMGGICNWPPEMLRDKIRESNNQSARGSQEYVIWENRAILNDYEFIACPCDESCWCKRHSCTGHYRIKEITFDEFLETYVTLWTPPTARENIKKSVRFGISYNRREKNAVEPLQRLRTNWSEVLTRVRGYNKCGLCDSPLPVVDSVFPSTDSVTNLYQAKIWSQLFYDSIVPFDTKSKTRLTKEGYADPTKHFMSTNEDLFGDLRRLSETAGMNIDGVRNLDTPWSVVAHLKKPSGGQPLSRVLDKMFYAPK